MHGKGERTEAAHARAARASEGHGRALLPCAFLLALVALLLVPTRAYADGANYRTVLWSGDYASGKQYIVGADNKYDAAAYICGQTSAQVAAYDLTVRYKLSATENDFAALADSLEKDWPGWNEDTLAQSLAETFTRDVNGITLWDVMTQSASVSAGGGIIFNQGALSLFQVKYWQDSVDCDIYAVDTTSDAVSRARDDLQEILNGGGGGGSNAPGTYTFTGNLIQYSGSTTSLSSSYNYIQGSGDTITGIKTVARNKISGSDSYNGIPITNFETANLILNVPEGSQFDSWVSNLTGDYMLGITFNRYSQGSLSDPSALRQFRTLTVYAFDPTTFEYQTEPTTSLECFYRGNYNSSFVFANKAFTSMDGDTITIDNSGNGTAYNSQSYLTYTNPSTITLLSGNVDTGEDPPEGPGNWPSTPTNPNPDPEPPTVPDPPENPEPDPPSTPVAPTPPPLEPPTNVTIPTGTTAADYTPWLRAILEQLQTLTDELASHCVHLQEEMQTSVNELQDTLIYRFNSLENYLKDLFDGLEYYLCDMAEWLAEQLNYNVNVDPYDDSSVLYWLRQIYSRLGNQPKAPTTVMDPDPTEPFDFWAWLMNLIANTVGGIIGDLVGDVAGLLDLFKDKFPFSIPWDIAALLTLLDGTRATPAFDVKLAAVPGWWQETTFRIDLTPFDSVASACRTMVNILWVMVLVMKTDWMLAIMGDATSFGERFARKVARTS